MDYHTEQHPFTQALPPPGLYTFKQSKIVVLLPLDAATPATCWNGGRMEGSRALCICWPHLCVGSSWLASYVYAIFMCEYVSCDWRRMALTVS